MVSMDRERNFHRYEPRNRCTANALESHVLLGSEAGNKNSKGCSKWGGGSFLFFGWGISCLGGF